jgi:hypothetical protein
MAGIIQTAAIREYLMGSERRRTMAIANPEAEALTMKQRVFIGALGALSILLATLVLFYFSPVEETSKALPGRHVSPAVCEGSVQS